MATMSQVRPSSTSQPLRPAWLVAWILAIVAFGVGTYGIFLRFTEGHAGASYGSYVPWGLWIAAYVTYVGTSAGAFALAAIILLMRWEKYYGLARVAMLVALGAFATGMLNVVLDLGHPFRAWKLYTQTSPIPRSWGGWRGSTCSMAS